MEKTFTRLTFILALLISSCSVKEVYQFAHYPTDQSGHRRILPPIAAMPGADTIFSTSKSVLEIDTVDILNLTASIASQPQPTVATFPSKKITANFKAAKPGKLPLSKLTKSLSKISKQQENYLQKNKSGPDEEKKPVNRWALIGFILALSGVGLIILTAATGFEAIAFISLLATVGGLITSIIGLNKINQNPDKYAGRRKAKAGIAISIGTLVFYVVISIAALILIAFLNAMSSAWI